MCFFGRRGRQMACTGENPPLRHGDGALAADVLDIRMKTALPAGGALSCIWETVPKAGRFLWAKVKLHGGNTLTVLCCRENKYWR